ncbi:MAG TPA: T9SS type A sorting domain-containing protein [Bacteroidales bacterium]|nr:T9SS type A sorting domain-containing protein [Bacteroidales bacterium]
MKNLSFLLLSLAIFLLFALQGLCQQDFLPPFNFRVDSTTLMATWEAPKIVLLNEDFEGDMFPPEGWADTTLGSGWQCDENPLYHAWWMVPPHTGKVALVNDDWIPNNNGSLDFLYFPEMDLTFADSFSLRFDSYFDGAYGQTAYVKYSVDDGDTWLLLKQMEPSLLWQRVEIDLSEFSGTNGISNFKLAFYTNDRPDNLGWWGSGWAVDNVAVISGETTNQAFSYKVFLDTTLIDCVPSTYFQYSFEYNTTHICAVMACYNNYNSDPVEQSVHSACFPKPTELGGSAPDEAVILTWSPPMVMHDGPAISIAREHGDVLRNFPSPPPISSCYGICDDGTGLWVSDPNRSGITIFKVTYDGVNTGETITLSQGQSWIGDMVSDGNYLYCCLIGGSNRIGKVYLPTGEIVGTIGGDFTVEPQMGLAADFENEEFYIGGWNSNMIWRTHFNGNTISTHNINNVSGLAWSPPGNNFPVGTLWVTTYASTSWIHRIDPNSNWIQFESFMIPGGEPYAGAGIEIKTSGYFQWTSLWICNQVENRIYLADIEEILIPGPQPSVPDNLLGFNLYKNGEFLDYIDYTAPDSCGYVDPISSSEYYEGSVLKYEVNAVYDMTPYGFPGETEESLPEGPAEIILFIYWFELDFLEDWSAGNFDDNAWYITDSNWTVSQDIGNKAPCAVFMPAAPITDYEATLESYHFLELSAHELILEYDVSLSSVNPTGNEKLQVQVFDGTNRSWNTVKTFTNAEGSFDWRKDSLDIAGAFNTGRLRIRFNATGVNSSDISYWAVDNIALTRICPAPDSIETTLIPSSEDSVQVTWAEPTPPIAEWRQWDDGVPANGIGFGTSKDSWFNFAIRWTPELLIELKGASITAVGFIPYDVSACFKIALWSGDDPVPFYTQAAGNLNALQWGVFQLDTPQKIDITKDLYVGYQISTYCDYPISVDNGPAVDSLGNLFRFGNGDQWTTLLEINPEFNWNLNIKAFFERDGIQYESFYRVYRGIDGSEPELITETIENELIDPVGSGTGMYCYKVQTLFYNGCESEFSPESCVLITKIPFIEEVETGTVKIYPNPASEVLYIESPEKIESVSIFDCRGITIEQSSNRTGEQTNGRTGEQARDHVLKIPLNGLAPGLYLVRVETGGGVVARKVVVK